MIPEFLYTPGYDESGRMRELERGNPRVRVIQKGKKEHLLCRECEELLNRNYEAPMARIWSSLFPSPLPESTLRLANLPYETFRLFHLSVLWRAGEATDDFWAEVRLGPEHRERLRRMLIAGDPGDPDLYPIGGNVVLNDGTRSPAFGWVASPTKARDHSVPAYTFLYGGCAWRFYVAGHRVFSTPRPWILARTGELELAVRDVRMVLR